ncbi:hypothetical protein PK98_14820 [Croceibacterium mercuriale]|uniref:Acyltransferase 3 domain-containing protein n=2 Tax=Croceibacterium mercuriale TaxID=1572751 RepID=A0A0B2BX85_9SPHN|nr:hypothetical protein PK98_14820 [Croceibacterium mercuriale]
MISRARRLYPFYFVGLMLGLAVRSYQDPTGAFVALPMGLLGLPTPGSPADYLYPLNSSYWSLFAEWLANVALVLFFWRLRSQALLIVTVAGAGALLWVWRETGTLHGGFHWADIGVGLARVAFAFPLGMLLYQAFVRFDLGRFRAQPSWLGAALPILILPCFFGLPDLLIVLIVFPVLVLAGAAFEPHWPSLPLWLGEVSYPLYCLHAPLQVAVRFVAVRSPWPEVVGLLGFCAVLMVTAVAVYVVQRQRRYTSPIPATT